MKEIRDYVEVMFKDFPKTKEAVEMKLNILDTMEAKYNDLIAEGKNKHEAIGTVIAQFGNIDELKSEFGMEYEEGKEYLSNEEINEYVEFKHHFGNMIALGTAMIIVAVGFMAFVMDTKYEDFTTFLMFIPIGIAVLIFILNGLKYSKYKDMELGKFSLHSSDMTRVRSDYNNFRAKFSVAIASGVFLCIMGVASVLLMEDILKLGENSYGLTLFPLVAVGVFLFIRYGIMLTTYKILLGEHKLEEECEEGPLEWLYGLTMPFATIVFLLIGFTTDIWHPTWIVFPIMVFITEAIQAIYKHKKDK